LNENELVNPPIRLNLLDSDGNKIESAGFLDATYTAEVTVASGDPTFAVESVTTVNFDGNGQAVFDTLIFSGFGAVTLSVSLTSPDSTGLADFTLGPYTVVEAVIPDPEATSPPEEPCVYTTTSISCVANNLDTSTTLLNAALDAMTLEELGQITWLSINQNTGLEGIGLDYILD